jgi:protease-4
MTSNLDTETKSEIHTKEALGVLKQYFTVYKRTNYGKLILLGSIIALGLIGNLMSVFSTDKPHIAVVNINGEIGTETDTGNGKKIASHILSSMNNDDVDLIVIEANSPGGSPTDSQTINEIIVQYKHWGGSTKPGLKERVLKEINNPAALFDGNYKTSGFREKNSRKLIVAVITAQCASACVQAIINADVIIAQRASLVGNIGVRLDTLNWSDLAKKVGVTNTTITSAEFKDILNPWNPVNDDQIQIAKKTLVAPVFQQFKDDVLEARSNKLKVDHEVLFSGLAWSGVEAKEIGLVDAISNPVAVQSALEKMSNRQYKVYSKNSFSLNSFIQNPFASIQNL